MSVNCIKMERVWSDESCMEIKFTARGENIESTIYFYTTEEYLLELKQELINYPFGNKKSFEWGEGSNEENSYRFFNLNVFLYDKSGHVAIEVEMDNKSDSPHTLHSHFFILTEVGSLNEFGKQIDKLLIEDGISIEGIIHR